MMEHKFVEMAKKELGVEFGVRLSAVALAKAEVRKQVHDKSAVKDQSGMICSGEQTILLYPVKKSDASTINQVISSLEENGNGTLRLSPEGIFFTAGVPDEDFKFIIRAEDDWEYFEKTGYKHSLFIIGGGHCALALSRLVCSMDFYIRVYDDRKELKTMMENNAAHEKYIVNNYAELKEMIPPGRQHYVVIMTFGYRSDDIALSRFIG
jgi:xanthine dehydrogenase accessory factor